MKRYYILMEDPAARFYERIAEKSGTTPERLMSSVLFKFAGELAVKAVKEKQKPKS